jgi:hypothetical protein
MPGGLKKVRPKLGGAAAIALVATLIVWFIALFALNRSAEYGRFNIPGNAVVQLSAGEVDLAFNAQVTSYGGNSNVSLPIPNLRVSVVPVGGGLVPGYENSVGSTTSVNSDAHIRFAKIDVPVAGRYRVTVSGDVGGFIDPQIELGAPGLAGKILFIGGAAFFLMMLVYTLIGLAPPAPTPGADSPAAASAAFGEQSAARRPLPWKALGIEVIGAVGLLASLLASGGVSIPPQGSVNASGTLVSGSTSSSSSSSSSGRTNLLTAPLPSPTAADTIPADSTSSLFHQANLGKALQALTTRLGGKADIAAMAIYPGELDVVYDDPSGALHRVRVALDDAVTVGPKVPTYTSPTVIYVNELDALLISTIAARLTNEQHTPTSKITELVLDNHLPSSNSGWNITTAASGGKPGPTFNALLDGTGVERVQ